jgi:hypothetical protein
MTIKIQYDPRFGGTLIIWVSGKDVRSHKDNYFYNGEFLYFVRFINEN